jgi:hypothetical protein
MTPRELPLHRREIAARKPGAVEDLAMERHRWWIAVLFVLCVAPSFLARAAQDAGAARQSNLSLQPTEEIPLTMRPSMLADHIEEFAGRRVRIQTARVVGLFETNAFLIEPATPYLSPLGFRDRVLVLVDRGALRVPAETLVTSTVTIVGVARTPLGLQVSAEVPWPAELDRETMKRLEVRAAVLATSVQTAEGIELTAARR